MKADLRVLASQYMTLLEDIDDNVAAGRASIADIATVRTVLDSLTDMVIDNLTAAVAENMDRERVV